MQVHFDFASQRISIEGDGPELLQILSVARELAPKFSSIEILTRSTGKENPPPDHSKPNGGMRGTAGGAPKTMRQFVRSLSLDNAMEKIAGVAYYQKHYEESDIFSPKQMDGWFVQCGFQKPANISVTLADTRTVRGYIENIGRGKWKVTRQGENLILGKLEQPAEE